MKSNAKLYRQIIAVIGIALLAPGLTPTSRADGGKYFADKFTSIDVPAAFGSQTEPYGINPQGDIVGYCSDSSGNTHGFLLRNGQFTTFDVPGGEGSTFAQPTFAQAINPQGDIVGWYDDSGGGNGFLLKRGSFTTIDVPGASYSSPNGINPEADVVGYYFNNVGGGLHGFLLSKGTYTTIDVPATLGSVTAATAINPQGDIVGFYEDASFNLHGFLLSR
jgi:probable HAF family extracellular repeat protein